MDAAQHIMGLAEEGVEFNYNFSRKVSEMDCSHRLLGSYQVVYTLFSGKEAEIRLLFIS